MSEFDSGSEQPFKIEFTIKKDGQECVVNIFPDGENARMQIASDISKLGASALREIITGTLLQLREDKNDYGLYYKLPKVKAGGMIATALHGNGFEIHHSTDDFDYYSPLNSLDREQIAEIGQVDFAPELVDSIERIVGGCDDVEQLEKQEFNLRYKEFDRFTANIRHYIEEGQVVYWLTIKQKHRSESVFRTRYPTEVIELHLSAETGKIVGYNKKMEYLDESNEPVPMGRRAAVDFALNPDDEQFMVIDEDDAPALREAVTPTLSVEQLEEIQDYMNMLLVEYSVD